MRLPITLITLKLKIMSYTIVGMFPNNEDAEYVAVELGLAGFPREDYYVTRYSPVKVDDKKSSSYDNTKDEETIGFWNWLFGDPENNKNRYCCAGTKSSLVTVYTDDLDLVEKAREIMTNEGAINVNEFTKKRCPQNTSRRNDLTEVQSARIINSGQSNFI